MLRSVGRVPTVPHFDIGGCWKGSDSASFRYWGVLEGFRQCLISILGGVGRVPTVPHFNIGGIGTLPTVPNVNILASQ